MNTNLFTPNTGCTTKNLKMIPAVMIMTAVFIFINLAAFAQGASQEEAVIQIPVTGKILTLEEGHAQQKQAAINAQEKPVNAAETKATQQISEVAYPVIPGFKATGNAAADEKAFKEAKLQLYNNNPKEYKKYFTEKP